MSKNNTSSFVLGAIFGAAVASVTTLLFAPQSGEKTRRDIADKTNETYEQANEYFDIAKEKGNEFYKNVRDTGEEYFDQASKQAEKTFNKVKDESKQTAQKVEDKASDLKNQAEDKAEKVKDDLQSDKKSEDLYKSKADADDSKLKNANKIAAEKKDDDEGYI